MQPAARAAGRGVAPQGVPALQQLALPLDLLVVRACRLSSPLLRHLSRVSCEQTMPLLMLMLMLLPPESMLRSPT